MLLLAWDLDYGIQITGVAMSSVFLSARCLPAVPNALCQGCPEEQGAAPVSSTCAPNVDTVRGNRETSLTIEVPLYTDQEAAAKLVAASQFSPPVSAALHG